jgi:ribonuclease P protein component
MLSKRNRLQKTEDFQNVHKNGSHIKGTFGKLVILRSPDEHSRFGVVVSADKGDAAYRNRAKRQVKSVFRDIVGELEDSWDMFYVVWNLGFSYDQIDKEIRRLIQYEVSDNGIH